jgi:hypothetical protein
LNGLDPLEHASGRVDEVCGRIQETGGFWISRVLIRTLLKTKSERGATVPFVKDEARQQERQGLRLTLGLITNGQAHQVRHL